MFDTNKKKQFLPVPMTQVFNRVSASGAESQMFDPRPCLTKGEKMVPVAKIYRTTRIA